MAKAPTAMNRNNHPTRFPQAGTYKTTPPTMGERCLGWLLVIWPLSGALSVSVAAPALMPQVSGWDYAVWIWPLMLTVTLMMLSSMLPGYAVAWGLCALGDFAERRGLSRHVLRPVMVVLMALLGAWQLSSVSGSWQADMPYAVRGVFVLLTAAALGGLLYSRRALITSGKGLRIIYTVLLISSLMQLTVRLPEIMSTPQYTTHRGNRPAGWAGLWYYKGPGCNPLHPQGKDTLGRYTDPNQDPKLNRAFLQAILSGTTPPPSTTIHGRLGYANTELVLFTTIPQAEAEAWLLSHFPGCKWQPLSRHMGFCVMEREYLPADYQAAQYTRLPDADGARRYIIHRSDSRDYAFLRIPGPFAPELTPQKYREHRP